MTRWWLASLVLLACPAPAGASAFVNLTGIQVTALSNGVRIEFRFDGTFQKRLVYSDLFTVDSTGTDHPKALESIRFSITNARTEVGAFYDVSRYPVSHVEITIPPAAPEGVGLDIAIPLMAPARLDKIDGDRFFDNAPEPPAFDIADTQDRRGLVITVISDRQQILPETRKSESQAAGLPRSLTASAKNGRVHMVAVNAGLHAVLAALNQITDLRVDVDDSVQRIVNACFPDASPAEILEGLADGYGLALAETPDGALLTDAAPHPGYRFTAVPAEIIPLHYLTPTLATSLLPDFLRPLVRPDTDSNALAVTGPPALVDKLRRDLGKLDQPAPQIAVDVLAVETSNTRTLDQSLGLSFAGRWQASTASDTGDITVDTTSQRPRDLGARLNALASRGSVRIHVEPTLTLTLGEPGQVFVGQERFIIVGKNRGFGRPEGQLQQVNVGTTLNVQAWGGPQGPLTVKLTPDVTTLLARDSQTGLPVVQRRTLTSTLRVSDGDTVVIGGLQRRLSFPVRRKIPILGDIPLLGALFRSASHDRERDSLVLFVTVHILPDGVARPSLAGPAAAEPAHPAGRRGSRSPRPLALSRPGELRPLARPSAHSSPAVRRTSHLESD